MVTPKKRKSSQARKPIPRCLLCNRVKQQHAPGLTAADCPGFIAPDPASAAAGGPERERRPSTPPSPERTPTRRGRPGAAEIKRAKQALSATVALLDGGAHFVVPKIWTDDDRLQVDEVQSLVDATSAELEIVAPDVLRWLAQISESSVHIAFMFAIALVALPRLERRGIVPPGTSLLFAMAPVSMATGGPPVSGGGDGNGQVHADSVAASAVVVPNRYPDEIGQADGEGL